MYQGEGHFSQPAAGLMISTFSQPSKVPNKLGDRIEEFGRGFLVGQPVGDVVNIVQSFAQRAFRHRFEETVTGRVVRVVLPHRVPLAVFPVQRRWRR